MDNLTKEQRHKVMKSIRPKNTSIEVTLCKALWKRGYRYRKNYKKLPGSPDIVLTKYRIAIFCDGEFFHGKDWDKKEWKVKKGHNGEYWVNKIDTNIKRDAKVEHELFCDDWIVVRFWGKDILKHTDECVDTIEDIIFEMMVDRNYH